MATQTGVHGISTYELPTAIDATVTADSAVNFVVGLAPVHRVPSAVTLTLNGTGTGAYVTSVVSEPSGSQGSGINTPVLCNDIEDFVNAFTYDDTDFATYTLCQHAYRAMIVGKVGTNFYVNVLDPNNPSHYTVVPMASYTFVNGQITIQNDDVIYNSLYIVDSGVTKLYTLGTDYVMNYIANEGQPDNNFMLITWLENGTIPLNGTVKIGYNVINTAAVTADDIVGTYNSATQSYTGLQAIETVFPTEQIVPSVICIPTWDVNPTVAAAMDASCLVNNVFKAVCTVQIDTSVATAADFALEQKTSQNIEASNQIACWPETGLGNFIMSMSTQIAVQLAEVDIQYNFLPYASPSNNPLPMDRLCLANGKTILQNKPNADLLSGQAIVTGINWIGGWRSWGNYTAAYPGTTDPKDMWIANRRMENYVENTLQLTAFQYVDKPMGQRWAETVVDTIQQWLNSMLKVGALLEGTIALRAQDNTIGELEAGHAIFYIEMMSPIPAQWIQFNIEVDPTALNNLFTLVNNAATTASQAIKTSTGS